MPIIWCGGEDIDLVMMGGITVDTTAGYYRSGYARCSLKCNVNGAMAKSPAFTPVTSAWMQARVVPYSNYDYANGAKYFGLQKSGTSKGLYLGIGGADSKIALYKYDGTTWTVLAQEPGTSVTSTAMFLLTMEIVNFGASSTVRVYLGGVLLFTFTGNSGIAGISDLDTAVLLCSPGSAAIHFLSEIIVADEDPRTLSLVTLAPSGPGESNAWNGDYQSIDEVSVDTLDMMSSNTAEQDVLIRTSDLPAGSFSIRAVRIAAHAAKGSTGITSLAIGHKVGYMPIAGAPFGTAATYDSYGGANTKGVRKWTLTENTSIAAVRVHVHTGNYPTAKVRPIVYADSAGSPGALLATGPEVVGFVANSVVELALTAPVSVTAGQAVWVGTIQDTSFGWRADADAGALAVYNNDTYSDGPSDPFGSGASATSGGTKSAAFYPAKASGQAVSVGGPVTLATAWDAVGRILETNPATGLPFTQTEVDALQIALRSKT